MAASLLRVGAGVGRNNLGLHQHQRRCISSSALTVERTVDTSRFETRPPKEELKFGTTMSDHMLMIEWNAETKWGAPRIVPHQNLSISPAASCLHYGMKAYKSLDNEESLRLFRPDCNMERLSDSMNRLNMPGMDFDRGELVECIKELVQTDKDWIPSGEGYSLYLRPTVIATHEFLGLSPPNKLLLYVITSPVGPYYPTGFKPIRLTADSHFVRAWPGGTGNSKVGGNYAPTMKPQAIASKSGYSQVLWLFGPDDSITEVGAMNVFFLLQNADTGRTELVTPPLTRGDILPGVTRRSILELASSWGEFDVVERFPTMPEIRDAAKENRLFEAFGAGTAAVVTPISAIQYKGEDIEIPATGKVTQRIWDEITGIQYGKIEGPEGWSIKL
eukprot:scaffold88486_cov46-Attheya_sp.AAC.1